MEALLRVEGLKKYFKSPKGTLKAVDGISFSVHRGTTLGIVGESGCGKSTLGRAVVNLSPPTSGEVWFKGKGIAGARGRELEALRRDMQMIFQDPYSSLDPRMSVAQIIAEPLRACRIHPSASETRDRVRDLMETVGLSPRFEGSYPHELDGGRRQRVGIARALALGPEFVVCDEPVSSLDVSIQAQILNLMQDLQEEKGLTYLFISHDLSVVRHISSAIIVMYLGRIVECCPTDELFEAQYHPYTRALLSAVFVPRAGARRSRILLKGEIPSPINIAPGCRFAGRCLHAQPACGEAEPELEELTPGHLVACRRAHELSPSQARV